MAQGFLAAEASRRGLRLEVSSAGTLPGERRISPNALEVMGDEALHVADHTSRELVAHELAAVDVVVGMAREHVREAVLLEPSAWPKAFTLKELVRRGEAAGSRRTDEPLQAWLERIAEDRRREDLLGFSDADDVADPYNAPMPVLRATAAEIRGLVHRLLDLMGA
jgi:protein-tyrosine-phosphatase